MRDTAFPVDPEELAAHADRLRGLVQRLVSDPGRVDDVLQETNFVALTQLRRREVPLYAWLAGIARNLVRRERRTAARRERREAAVARPIAVPPTDVVERADFTRLLVEQLVALDEPYRRTLLLRFFDGLDTTAIAERTSVPASTVRTHVKRGLELLRGRLDARHAGDRRAWLSICGPFLVAPHARGPALVGSGAAGAGTGVILMATTKMLAAAAAALVLAAGLVWFATHDRTRAAALPVPPGSAAAEPQASRTRERGAARERPPAAESPAVPAPPVVAKKGVCRVAGRVLLPDGSPAVGAAVRLPPSYATAWVETDAAGRFVVDALRTGDHVAVWVVMPGCRTPPISPVVLAQDADIAVPDVLLEPDSTVVLRGRLRSSDGRPLEGARVALWWATGSAAAALSTSADPGLYEVLAGSPDVPPIPAAVKRLHDLAAPAGADGAFELTLPASLGRAALFATASGHCPGLRTPFRVADVVGTEIEITLAPLPHAEGQVVDALTGAAIADAGIGFFMPDREEPPSRTDANGRFDVAARDGPGLYIVSVVAKGYLPTQAEPDAHDAPLRIALWPARPIQGRVEFPDGTPVGDVYVSSHPKRSLANGRPGDQGAYTDRDGRFVLSYLTDEAYSVRVSMGDRGKASFVEQLVDDVRGGTADLRIVVQPALDISGKLVDGAGDPVSGLHVYALTGTVASSNETTGADGRFVLRGLPAGSYTLYVGDNDAAAGGYVPYKQPDVAAGTTGLTLVMRRGESITGLVVDDDGHPVSGRRVVAAVADSDPFLSDTLWQRATTDGDGRFTLPGLSPGEVRIQMDRDSLSFDSRWWLVGGERLRAGSRDVRLVLTQGASIAGEVIDATGAPVAKSRVDALWTPSASGGRHTFTDDRGRFEIRGLPPGRTYTVASVNGRVRDVAAGTRELLRLAPQE